MRKLINGRIVDIKNIELFEKAAEGAAVARTLHNIIPSDRLDIDFKLVDDIILTYKKFYNSLPYPLYGIDSDLKYCSAGLFIRKELLLRNKMWVDNGLYILIDEPKRLALGFVNNSWGIVNITDIKEDNLNIQDYREYLGFDDFVWVTASLFKGEPASNYYNVFMSKFVEACFNQPVVMRWELGNMLHFSDVPEKLDLPTNKIISLTDKSEYSLDIFTAGIREQKDKKQQVWSFVDTQNPDNVTYKKTRVYGYDLYEKPPVIANKAGGDKIRSAEVYGINSLFCTLCAIKSSVEAEGFSEYKGFIHENNFIYLIDNRLFVAKSNMYVEGKEIARGVDIYSYKPGIVYIVKQKNISAGVKKESIYSYGLADDNLRLCKVQFVRA